MKQLFTILFLMCWSNIACAHEQSLPKDDLIFYKFLQQKLESKSVTADSANDFDKVSWKYWHLNKNNYNQNPDKYKKILNLFYKNKEKYKQPQVKDLNRFNNKVEHFSRFDNRNTIAKNAVLFVGSSSIEGWETSKSFPELPVINRGLGGISLAHINNHYDVLIKKHAPKTVVIYCDIDIESGKSPNEALSSFETLTNRIQSDFPKTNIILMAMKPTLIDDFLGKDVRLNKGLTNKAMNSFSQKNNKVEYSDVASPMLKADGTLREDIFIEDGMHLNDKGYQLWSPILQNAINAFE